jgi:predicted dehydrogenase
MREAIFLSMQANPIRVGLIGYGFSGKTFHAPLIRAVPGLSLDAVASSDPKKVQLDLPGVAIYEDPFALARTENIDVVVIATPNTSHAPLARAALAAKKHVVIDKPFTLDLVEARDLIAQSKMMGLVLSVFHNRRWDSDFLTVRQAIKQGMVGAVIHYESHIDRFRPEVRNRWRENGGPGSGVWFDLGPHLVDQALQLFGLPDRVQANLARQRPDSRTDDWAHVVLEFGAQRAILHASMVAAGGTSRFIVHGDAGSIVKRDVDLQEKQLLSGMRPGEAGWGEDPNALIAYDRSGEQRIVPATRGDQRLYYAGLVEALNGSTAGWVTPIQALAVMAVVEAAVDSARSRNSVELPLTVEERGSWARSGPADQPRGALAIG